MPMGALSKVKRNCSSLFRIASSASFLWVMSSAIPTKRSNLPCSFLTGKARTETQRIVRSGRMMR